MCPFLLLSVRRSQYILLLHPPFLLLLLLLLLRKAFLLLSLLSSLAQTLCLPAPSLAALTPPPHPLEQHVRFLVPSPGAMGFTSMVVPVLGWWPPSASPARFFLEMTW
mmetsp:Transcript_26095/g.85753  ORF Transcript_26095/g.85753 Transcript_26095/m.85753 type:complete len:108 (+) Transcript_26095:1221-1544(+)